jgi:hypothetical protein
MYALVIGMVKLVNILTPPQKNIIIIISPLQSTAGQASPISPHLARYSDEVKRICGMINIVPLHIKIIPSITVIQCSLLQLCVACATCVATARVYCHVIKTRRRFVVGMHYLRFVIHCFYLFRTRYMVIMVLSATKAFSIILLGAKSHC